MKTIKFAIICVLSFSFFNTLYSEERVKPIPMTELTDPASSSYVPYPYPKNNKEITEDLKYAINKLYVDSSGSYVEGKIPEIKTILIQLIDENSNYKIGHTVRVKNRLHRMAHDYTWLILITNENEEVVARISMMANGLFGGAQATGSAGENYRTLYPGAKCGPQHFVVEQDVLNRLSEEFGRPVDKSEIIKMERVAFPSTLGDLRRPLWEIILKSGKTLYYSLTQNTIYEIDKRINWKRNSKGARKSFRELVPHLNFLPDTVNEELVVLKRYQNQ